MTPLLLLAFACHKPAPTVQGDAPDGHLIIAHTNDIHAHFQPAAADWVDGKNKLGGFVAIKSHLDALRFAQGDDAVIYLDAGDILTGTPLMEFEVHGAYGGAMLDFLDESGCRAWALGNHELDRGYPNAATIVSASPMPVLTANLRKPGALDELAFPGMKRHEIIEANGVTVGIFGLTTTSIGRLASKDTMANIEVVDAAEVAREEVAALESQVDLIIALTHVGFDADKQLAQEVDGIDLIVGGHSHTRLEKPVKIDNTWIVQTAGEGRQLGVVEFDVTDGGRITRLSGGNVDLVPDALPFEEDPVVLGLTARWQDSIEKRFTSVIGTLDGDLDRDGAGETSMGRWASDVVRSAGWADVGLYNGSGVRADLDGGDVTLGDLYGVFPFSNQVVSFEITGDELVRLMLTTVHAETGKKRATLQWSGVTFTWRMRMDTPELVDIRVNDQPLDLDHTYRIATNSYVAEQWEYNLGFEPRNLEGHGLSVLEAAEATLRAGPVVAPADLRSIRVQD